MVSAASNPDGNAIITGHLDGSINRFFFDDGISGASQVCIISTFISIIKTILKLLKKGKFVMHTCVPTAIGWGENILAVGNDQRAIFYNNEGYQKINRERKF